MTTFDRYEHGQFCWVDLSSHGIAEARAFYGKLFGWVAEDQDTESGPPYVVFMLDGNAVAGLGELNAETRARGIPPSWNSYINVDDVDATARKAEQHGATITVPPMTVMEAGRLCFLTDPTGAEIALWQKVRHIGAQVCNEPGSLCWNELLTRDIDRAMEFYAAVIGWKFQRHSPSPNDYFLIQAKSGMNGGIIRMTGEFGDIPPQWSVYLAIDDADVAATRAIELGGKVIRPPFDTPVGKIAVLADTHGAAFSVLAMK